MAFEELDDVAPGEMSKGKIRSINEHVNVHIIVDVKMGGRFTRRSILCGKS